MPGHLSGKVLRRPAGSKQDPLTEGHVLEGEAHLSPPNSEPPLCPKM